MALLGLRRRCEGDGTTIPAPDDNRFSRNCGSRDGVLFQHDALGLLLQARAHQAAAVLRQIESHAIKAISLAHFAEEV